MDAVEGFSLVLLLSATLLYTASAAKDKELYCGGMFKFKLSFLMRLLYWTLTMIHTCISGLRETLNVECTNSKWLTYNYLSDTMT